MQRSYTTQNITVFRLARCVHHRFAYVLANYTQQTSRDSFTNPSSWSAWQQHTRAVHGATGPDESASLILPAPHGLPPGCLHILVCMKPASIFHAQSLQPLKSFPFLYRSNFFSMSIEALDCPHSTLSLNLCADRRAFGTSLWLCWTCSNVSLPPCRLAVPNLLAPWVEPQLTSGKRKAYADLPSLSASAAGCSSEK